MRIENEIKLDYSDVLIRPKRSNLTSRRDVCLTKEYSYRWGGGYAGIPIMAANMDGVGTLNMWNKLCDRGLAVCLTRVERDKWFIEASKGTRIPGDMIPTFGITKEELERLDYITNYWSVDTICLDVANGYQENFVDTVKKVRNSNARLNIIAGNVVTGEMTEELLLAGADVIKVGIGQGSTCTTRLVTGVGYPQLSAVIECADAAHGLKGHIIADGGIVHIGDVAKAFGAGADFVMMGGMFAGHDEGGMVCGMIGDFEVKFYGNSSSEARDDDTKSYRASEGRVTKIPYKGKIDDTINDVLGGLRSACTYCGAATLKELPKRTTFIRVNSTHNPVFEKYTVGK